MFLHWCQVMYISWTAAKYYISTRVRVYYIYRIFTFNEGYIRLASDNRLKTVENSSPPPTHEGCGGSSCRRMIRPRNAYVCTAPSAHGRTYAPPPHVQRSLRLSCHPPPPAAEPPKLLKWSAAAAAADTVVCAVNKGHGGIKNRSNPFTCDG